MLKVTAHEKTGGNKKSIVINAKTNRLSHEQIDRMIKVAELFSDEDKVVKQRIDAKNDLESYVSYFHLLGNNYFHIFLKLYIFVEKSIERSERTFPRIDIYGKINDYKCCRKSNQMD